MKERLPYLLTQHLYKMRSPTKMAMLAVMSAFIFMACSGPAEEQKPAVDLEKIKVEIQAMEDAYAAAEVAKNADGVAAYYSDDAVSFSRNEEPATGKAAIRERIAKRLATDTTGNKPSYTVVNIFAEGKMLVEVGAFTQTNPMGQVADKGYYMSYFENKDGKYQCVRDMSVTTMPAK